MRLELTKKDHLDSWDIWFKNYNFAVDFYRLNHWRHNRWDYGFFSWKQWYIRTPAFWMGCMELRNWKKSDES